ncbi:MAG TPA: ATP-binding protein [Ktedonobacteraceae bacterium]|nr:ATP-binding protein [Ktedonobacteraceae bacterium]
MVRIYQTISQLRLRNILHPRLLIVTIGLIVQFVVLGTSLSSIGQIQSPDVRLLPLTDNPGICQVVDVRPFSDAWVHGIQTGIQVKLVNQEPAMSCQITTETVQIKIIGLPGHGVEVNVLSPPADFLHIATNLLLILIFSVTGIAIFLRTPDRPTARITYALFYCTSLAFCLFNLYGTNHLWLNLLGFSLTMIIRGLAATFVCLFPYSANKSEKRGRTRILPYLPLLVGIVLALASLPMPLAAPPLGFTFIAISFGYNVVCMLIVIGIMGWGLRHLNRQEKQFVRMVVISIIFLLLPLALSLNIVRPDEILQESLLRLIPIPLAVLPIACNYALFRAQLVGTASMLSRQAMRILLWILLISLFVFSVVILLRAISRLNLTQNTLDYIYAGLLVASLFLFPLIWNKVRDTGDQVFYGDFYEYNRSLHELSTALTHLQGIEQICTFILPRLAMLLNATETGLLLRATQATMPNSGLNGTTLPDWRIYRHIATSNKYASRVPRDKLSGERLVGIANLALTRHNEDLLKPILLDGVLLLALYDGNRCNGFLCLGPKFNLESYSKQDRSFLSTLASQLSALEVNSRYLEQAQSDAQQLAALSHRVISAQEEERRHLALELHDEALQQAMLVVRQLSDAGNMEEVAEVMPLARSVVASLRRTCLELRPPLLDELGLAEALQCLARQTEELDGHRLSISVQSSGQQVRPPAHVELALYRVGQEALSNIFKYAGANRASIRLRCKPGGDVSLLISDNGRGIQNKSRQAEHLGLIGMHERMASIGGTLQIRNSPGRGVTIRACLKEAVQECQTEALPLPTNSLKAEMVWLAPLTWEEVRT